MIGPREMLEMSVFRFESISNSSVLSMCLVCGLSRVSRGGHRIQVIQRTHVRGKERTRMSMSCLRKLCKLFFSSPLNHSDGNDPSASPVPGTMYPSSRFFSGVSFGVAVKASTSIPMFLATRPTGRCQYYVVWLRLCTRLTLPSNAAIAKDTNLLADHIIDHHSPSLSSPLMPLLLFVKGVVVVTLNQCCHDDPF